MLIRGKKVVDNWTYSTKLAGNWQHFSSFGWQHAYDGELIEPQRYMIYYVEHRDSDILDQSNSQAIKTIMKWYLDHGFCHLENHSSWLVGWQECIVMPVYTLKGKITKTFEFFVDNVLKRLESYSLLDEQDFCEREYNQQYDNVMDSIHWYERKNNLDLSESQKSDIFNDLLDNVLCGHDSDYYPSNEDIETTLDQLGIEK